MLGKVLLLGVALSLSGVVHADSMRCGSKIVNESVTPDELIARCGQPQERKVEKADRYLMNANGFRVKTEGQTVTERWVYQPTPGKLPMAVHIVDGKIISITRAE
jgi:hypothetical protein